MSSLRARRHVLGGPEPSGAGGSEAAQPEIRNLEHLVGEKMSFSVPSAAHNIEFVVRKLREGHGCAVARSMVCPAACVLQRSDYGVQVERRRLLAGRKFFEVLDLRSYNGLH